MILGDATLGNTTVGFSTTQTDVSLASSATSSLTGNTTAGFNLAFDSTANMSGVINQAINLATSPVATASTTLNVSKGRPVSIEPVSQTLGENSLGETTVGLTNQTARGVSNLFATVSKGRPVSLQSTATTSLGIFRRIDLTLASVATSSIEYNITKGVEVQFDARTNTTLVLVPDFDELIGRSRADSDRSLVVRADSDRTLIVRADANLN